MSQEQNKDMSQYFYRASAADFMKIPGGPVAYWVGDKVRNLFSEGTPIGDIAAPRKGNTTTDNSRFLRFWAEIDSKKSGIDQPDKSAFLDGSTKWCPYNKGGGFRKWYGFNEFLVNWESNGREIKAIPHSVIANEPFFFKPGLTWSTVTSGNFSIRTFGQGFIFDNGGCCVFGEPEILEKISCLMNSKVFVLLFSQINPTLNFQSGDVAKVPFISSKYYSQLKTGVDIAESDWNSFETAWGFSFSPLLNQIKLEKKILTTYRYLRSARRSSVQLLREIEQTNNEILIEVYGLHDELTPDVPLREITLTCNPHYRYGGDRGDEELETLLQSDTLRELVSYAIGCMMGRYSLDKPGLILASQGDTLRDYLRQIPLPRFTPDDDAILPLTDQEWFADDATNRFREFVRVVWGDEHLQENLDFVAESLCLHAIKPKRGESALDTIRRYLSTQFFKDHLRTYKKRPIYWLFSSGKHKAFECLVYLHRYQEGTLARMRTEYVIPLSAKLNSYADKLEQDRDASPSAAETKRLTNELTTLHKQQAELAEFDEKLRHYADQRISVDLDDGVKVNYGKFGDLLAEVKAVTGGKANED